MRGPYLLVLLGVTLVVVAATREASSGALAASGAPAALGALLTTVATEVDAEGVTRTSSFQERLIRDDGHAWIERVYPAGVTPVHAADEHGLNLRVAARSYTRVKPGSDEVQIALVSVPDKMIVDIGPESYAGLGLSSHWSVASQLVDLARLRPSGEAAPTGAKWYVRAAGAKKDYFRVLWSSRFQLPLAIESGSADGRVKTRTTIEPAVLPAGTTLPWTQLATFGHRDLSDLED